MVQHQCEFERTGRPSVVHLVLVPMLHGQQRAKLDGKRGGHGHEQVDRLAFLGFKRTEM